MVLEVFFRVLGSRVKNMALIIKNRKEKERERGKRDDFQYFTDGTSRNCLNLAVSGVWAGLLPIKLSSGTIRAPVSELNDVFIFLSILSLFKSFGCSSGCCCGWLFDLYGANESNE